ncbi:MAG: CHAT domain-containing protein [Flammeovirgaceae bacterium]
MLRFILIFSLFAIGFTPSSLGQLTPNEQLMKAITAKNLGQVKAAIKAGAKVDEMTATRFTPMRFSIFMRDSAIFHYLLEQKANLNYTDPQGYTHLHYACMLGYEEVVRWLLAQQVDLNPRDVIQSTPLMIAVRSNKPTVAALLLATKKVDLEAKGVGGNTALHLAVTSDSSRSITLLLEAGANLETPDTQGRTALHLAADHDNPEIVQLLIEAKAKVNAKDKSGDTPLMVAAGNKQTTICKLLLRAGADPKMENNSGETAIDEAKWHKDDLLVGLLEKPVSAEDSPEERQRELVELLRTAIRDNDSLKVVKLIDQGADMNYPDRFGMTPLLLAAQYYTTIIHYLVQHEKADLNATLPNGRNLLHLAADNHASLHWAPFLIEAGLAINSRDKTGWTPLMVAAAAKNVAFCQWIIGLGAQASLENNQQETAADIAKKDMHPKLELIAYLENPQTYRDDVLWKIRKLYPTAAIQQRKFSDWIAHYQKRIQQFQQPQDKLFELIRFAHFYEAAGKFDEAKDVLDIAIELGKLIGAAAHAQALSQLANWHVTRKAPEEALTLLENAWSIHDASSKPWDTVSLGIQNVFIRLNQPKNYPSKSAFYEAFLSAYDMNNKPIYSSSVYETHIAAAKYFARKGALDKTLPLKSTAVTVLSYVYGLKAEAQRIQFIYGDFALLEGNPYQAEVHLQAGLGIVAQQLGVQHPYYVELIHHLAKTAIQKANYASAELLLQEAKKQHAQFMGKNTPQLGELFADQGRLSLLEGNFELATNYAKQALAILQDFNIENDADLRAKQTLNHVQLRLKSYKNLAAKLKAVISETEQRFGADTPLYRELSLDLAKLHLYSLDRSKFNEAEQILLNTINTNRNLLIDQAKATSSSLISIQGYSSSMHLLGMLYHEKKEFKKAESWYMKSLENKMNLGDQTFASTYMNLARLNYQMGKQNAQDLFLKMGINTLLKLIDQSFPTLSEQEKQLFFHQVKDDFNFFNYYAYKHYKKRPAFLEEMYNHQLTTKALILTSSKRIRQLMMQSKDRALKEKYRQWNKNRNYLANLHLSAEALKQRGINIDSIHQVTNQLEKELAISSRDFEKSLSPKRHTWKHVQAQLKAHEAAIEIIRISHGKKAIYVALLITKNAKQPELIELPNGNHLEGKFLKYYRTAIEFKITDGNSYQYYWKPIQQAINNLGGIKKVYLSPDGVYNQINLKSIYNPKSDKYLIDEIKLELVTRTDDLLTYTESKFRQQGNALLLGKPSYKLDGKVATVDDEERSTRMARKIATLKSYNFADLPGTLIEVDSIHQVLIQYDWTVDKKIGKDAIEAVIKKLNKQTHVIHIATHGFFLGAETPDTSQIPTEERAFMPIRPIHQAKGLDPMLESGIVLAGVNNFVATEDLEAEDGILTAYEVIGLDLSATELVVLSACETGLGEVQNGEGVYGLQRALKVAGADAIMMSLWKVSDDATQLLMRAFYESWLQVGDKRKAFETAQLKVRATYPEPYYWGAFVLVGN